MKKNLARLLALALLLPSAAGAAEKKTAKKAGPPSPAPLNVEISPENSSVAFQPTLYRSKEFNLGVSLRLGALAVADQFAHPYPILMPSPYATGGLSAVYSGAFEAAGFGTAGLLQQRSQKFFSDPTGEAGSSAAGQPKRSQFDQKLYTGSLYGDVGKIVSIAPSLKGALFMAGSSFGLSGPSFDGFTMNGFADVNAGAMLMYSDKISRITLFSDVRGEPARSKFYRNAHAEYELATSVNSGAEVAHKIGVHELRAGIEVESRRADLGYRPYVGYNSGGVDAMVAGNIRESRNSFYPDVNGAGAQVFAQVAPGVKAGVQAAYNQERYALAPGPEGNTSVGIGLSWDWDHKAVVQSSVRYRQEQVKRAYAVQDSRDMNARLPGSGYSISFRNALNSSPTLEDFIRNVGATNTDSILAAVSAFSAAMGDNNYNYDEAGTPNVENMGELYRRARASYLNNKEDAILVCMGEAQFAAALAESLGKQAGVKIHASATTVRVGDKQGMGSGHAVAMVKSEQYGIVFVDWGRLTPTYTWNTKQALRIYQALQGMPEIYHQITQAGENGRHVGYLFSDEGRLMANKLSYRADVPAGAMTTLFDDDPRGDQVTVERYKNLLKKAFDQ